MNEKLLRSEGITHTEKYLKNLCDRSFLSLWSYSNLYRDQGGGKELCDLLVIFGDHVIIFSDKDCTFPNTGNLNLDWARWYKRAVKKSADQIFGAERWILSQPSRIFLDPDCKRSLPINLPSPEDIKIHRIAVAHSASTMCTQQLGGSGSLMINTFVEGDTQPFMLGFIDPTKGFVHVLDDTTLDILLTTLDTIYDFTSYLEKKEKLLLGQVKVISMGEKNS